MHIELDSGAKEWIELKGQQLTVKNLTVKSCCMPGIQELVAVPGKPKNASHFNEIVIDNLSIYVQKNIGRNGKLILKLSGFGIFKSISAKLQNI